MLTPLRLVTTQVHLASCLWLQRSILIITAYLSVAKSELSGQFTSVERSCNVETTSTCLRLFVTENVIWYTICLPFAHFSDYFYYNLVCSMNINPAQRSNTSNEKGGRTFLSPSNFCLFIKL